MTRAPRVLASIALAFVALGAGPLDARADGPSASDAAAAEALFHEGRRLLAAGDVAAACPKFAESYRLDPALGSLLNLASCHEREGRTASAWSEFREAEAQAASLGDAARQGLASQRAAALEGQLSRVRIVVASPPSGLVVVRDGVALGAPALSTPLPVDPGEHVLVARAPGHKEQSVRFTAVAGQSSRVDIPALEPLPAAPEPSRTADTAPSTGGSTRRTIALGTGIAGIAALAVGGVFVGLTAMKKGQADEHCPDKVCDAQGSSMIDTAKTYAYVADVGVGIGIVAVAVAGALIVTAPSTKRPASALRVLERASARATAHGFEAGALVRF